MTRLALLSLALSAPTAPAPLSPRAAAPEPILAADDAAQRGGYFLSARFAEGRDVPALAEAVDEMRRGALSFSPRDAPPPGFLLGHTSSVELAMAFVARWMFVRSLGPAAAGPPREVPAPVPGAPATGERPLHLLELTITGSTPDGDLRTIMWPSFAGAILPPEIPWKAAALTSRNAPLFAAPSATLPPAGESHAQVTRSGGLYALGALDRCEGPQANRRCLRWQQVVTREGDNFRGGYLPAYLVALHDEWAPAPDALPRAQVLPYAVVGELAHVLVVARGLDGVLRQAAVTVPAPGGMFPDVSVSVVADRLAVNSGAATTWINLDESFGR